MNNNINNNKENNNIFIKKRFFVFLDLKTFCFYMSNILFLEDSEIFLSFFKRYKEVFFVYVIKKF